MDILTLEILGIYFQQAAIHLYNSINLPNGHKKLNSINLKLNTLA